MIDISKAGTFKLGDRAVNRLGYGAMQLAGKGVFGPPRDRAAAIAVLREAVASGVDHIDTSDFYGPHVTNEIIREALHPYPKNLTIVTKIGAKRGADASWNPAFSAAELTSAVHDNLRNLKLEALDVVNLRLMFGVHGPAEGSLEAPLATLVELQRQGAVRGEDASWNPALSREALTRAVHDNLTNLGVEALDVVNLRLMGRVHGPSEGSLEAPFSVLVDLQRQGLIRHLGLSNVTSAQVAEARSMAEIVCVQNQYNIAHREDDALIDALAAAGIAYAPFFPLGGFTPLQSTALSDVAQRLGATPMQVALAWLLRRSPNILLIPGTSSVAHLRENLSAAALDLPGEAIAKLDAIAG
jgi:aryl-alcohol dehydrogenase-like predicted oxidoreductase